MDIISDRTRKLLVLSMIKGVGRIALKQAADLPGFWEDNLENIGDKVPQISRSLSKGGSFFSAITLADIQIFEAEKNNAKILSFLDDEYPSLLAKTKDDPGILYVKGSLFSNEKKSVAVIGTRKPTRHGAVVAHRVSTFFAQQGWSVVSGLAIGCDAFAHQAALQAGGHTVAVLAHGLQMIAPAQHTRLANDILMNGGGLISEYPFGCGVQGRQYVKRDRIQAGMSSGVVMVQSSIKGGSLHASRAALEYGRWLAVPYPTDLDRSNCEPSVGANLIVADSPDRERSEFLKCDLASLSNINILRTRDDYSRLLAGEGFFNKSFLGGGSNYKKVSIFVFFDRMVFNDFEGSLFNGLGGEGCVFEKAGVAKRVFYIKMSFDAIKNSEASLTRFYLEGFLFHLSTLLIELNHRYSDFSLNNFGEFPILLNGDVAFKKTPLVDALRMIVENLPDSLGVLEGGIKGDDFVFNGEKGVDFLDLVLSVERSVLSVLIG